MSKKTILKVAVVPVIVAIGFLTMQALGSTHKESKKRQDEPEPRAVETERLQFGELTLRVEGDGVIESERQLDVVSEVGGRVVYAKNDLKDGTFVRAGEVVVRIDSRDVENDLYGMRSDFMNAVASALPELRIDQAEIYKRWFDYFRSLEIDKPVPELPTITNPQEKMKISNRGIIGQYYAVKNRERELSKHVVRAPFSGYISSDGVIENSFVSVGQQLFTLTDPRNLVVAVPLLVQESRSIDFSAYPKATIRAEGADDSLVGRVTRRQATVERNSQSLQVFVTFANPELDPRYLPGSYVHVDIQGRTLEDVATIPRHLLDDEDNVLTMEADGTLGRQPVDILAYEGDMAVVDNTLPEETVIVTTILQKPLVGMPIQSIGAQDALIERQTAGADDTAEAARAGS